MLYTLQNAEKVLVSERYGNHRKRAPCGLRSTQKAFRLFVTESQSLQALRFTERRKSLGSCALRTRNERPLRELRNTQDLWSLRVTERIDRAHCIYGTGNKLVYELLRKQKA